MNDFDKLTASSSYGKGTEANDVPKITTIDDNILDQDPETATINVDKEFVQETLQSAKDILVKPFWKSTVIRVGAVVVAVTAVKTAGRIIIARNNAKFGV